MKPATKSQALRARKKRQQLHAALRLKEHYERRDWRIVRGAILQMIRNEDDAAIKMAPQTDVRSLWLVVFDGTAFYVIYSSFTNEIVTFLPHEAGLRKYKQYHRRMREALLEREAQIGSNGTGPGEAHSR
ncbi:MAG: hypothetical protein DWQ07_12890 [Chloroflexi bacterium]|nr:MAG: hypothetical protein DWQ07_12890 [Chloroflexota bacterium]MBL1196936.1 hypothetical protein [Chloroflexota bacterium]NOH14232.1 hypothetical protein [Chloroflexota bacterium]